MSMSIRQQIIKRMDNMGSVDVDYLESLSDNDLLEDYEELLRDVISKEFISDEEE